MRSRNDWLTILDAALGVANPDAVGDRFAGGAIAGFALAQRLRRDQSGAMQAINASGTPKQAGRQQRHGRQRDEPDLELRPVEPGLLAGGEQPGKKQGARDDNRQQRSCRCSAWSIAEEQGHPARIRAQRQHAQEKDDEAERRVQGNRSEEGRRL